MAQQIVARVTVVDSHTGGEPTRVAVTGGPDLGSGPLAARLARFRESHDAYRSAIVKEPRGSDVFVGALLVEPDAADCAAGVIFFNNVGYLGMCGHGMIGVVTTLAHLGRLVPGDHRIDTPVGVVTTTLHAGGDVSVTNVPSFRRAADVTVTVAGSAPVRGDVAWGGNWFYLVEYRACPLTLDHLATLTDFAWQLRQAVNAHGYPDVDHVELFGPPVHPAAHARNFVLCPGRAYDRSPCGTGTSAKLACLAADGRLAEGAPWVQEGILGSTFTARYRREGDHVVPTITGRAFICAEATLLIDAGDPFAWGIRS